MSLLYPVLFVDLFKQASYKNVLLLSTMHKQLTYFSKKYSKSNRIVLSKYHNLSCACEKDNVKVIKYAHNVIHEYNTMKLRKFKKVEMIKSVVMINNNLMFKSIGHGCIRIVRYILNNGYDIETTIYINEIYTTKGLLQYCVKKNHTNIAKLLFDKKIKICANYNYLIIC